MEEMLLWAVCVFIFFIVEIIIWVFKEMNREICLFNI